MNYTVFRSLKTPNTYREASLGSWLRGTYTMTYGDQTARETEAPEPSVCL